MPCLNDRKKQQGREEKEREREGRVKENILKWITKQYDFFSK